MRKNVEDRRYKNIRAKNLIAWYQLPYGQQIQQPIIQHVKTLLRERPLNSILHMNAKLYGDILSGEKITQVFNLGDDQALEPFFGEAMYLPMTSKSVDCVLLMHELDISENPHQLLRESERVLTDSGYLIIVGFNQLSLFGLAKFFSMWAGRPGEQCKVYNTNKIRDWLNLLNFDVEKSSSISYSLPINHPALQTKFKFHHQMAVRKGASFGNVYILMAKKRTVPITPVMFKWRKGANLSSTQLNPSSFATEKRVNK